MNPKYYKYTTIGLAGFIGAVALSYAAVMTPLFTHTIDSSEPHALENIPDTWAVATWGHEKSRAMYNSNIEDCILDIIKHDGGGDGMAVAIMIGCAFERGGETYIDDIDTHPVRVVTEPGEFDFHRSHIEGCDLSIHYDFVYGDGGEWLDARIYCHNIRD